MMAADVSTPVLVITGSSEPFLHGVMGIVRSLGRLGVPVHVVQNAARTPVGLSRYLQRTSVVDLEVAAPQAYLQRLGEIGRALGRRPVLMPVDDVTALFVAEHAEALGEWFVFPDQPRGLSHALANKRDLHLLCARLGVPTPDAMFPESRQEVATFAARAQFPVVMKAIDPVLLRQQPMARSVVIAQDPTDMLGAYDQMAGAGAPNLMLQEYLPGGADSVWMFNGYFDQRSECLLGFTGTKLRQYPPYTGATCLGICRRNPALEQMTIQFLKAVGYRGVVDLGYRYDPRSGRYKLLDVNPRIGATFRLFVAANGMDVARALYLDLTGQPVPGASAAEGRKWVVEHLDMLASRTYHRDRRLPPREWLRSFRGLQETAWFAWDDPIPFLALTQRLLKGALRRLGRRAGGGHGGNGARPAALQKLVDARFTAEATTWRDVYRNRHDDVPSAIYRYRHEVAAAWIDRLGIAPGSNVLEVGPGAGLMSAHLAQRGYHVQAMDRTSAMVGLTEQQAAVLSVESQVRATIGDAHALPFKSGGFSLLVALGVLPWLHAPWSALREMARVLRPSGYLVVSIDNRARLNHLVDPLLSPPLRPLRQATKAALAAGGLRPRTTAGTLSVATPKLHHPDELNDVITSLGLRRIDQSTFGFGPFTFFGRQALSEASGVRWNRRLQRLATSNLPGLRLSGTQYLLVAQKPAHAAHAVPVEGGS
jgi:D-aspartate ligase